MIKRPMLPPFAMDILPSRLWRTGVIMALSGVVLVALFYRVAPVVVLLPVVIAAAFWALRANGWFDSRHRITRLEVNSFGRLSVYHKSFPVEADVLDDCFVTPWLVILNIRVEGRRHSIMLWPDSIPEDSARLLRVYLRWFVPQLKQINAREEA